MSAAVRAFTAVPAPTQTVAALCTACLVLTAAPSPGRAAAHAVPVLTEPSISLTAQRLPLPLDLLNQQVVFNVGLFVDWVTTGAALFQRQAQIPGNFVAAISSGTPPPTAAAQALSAFADVEFEAGRDLVGFAQDIAVFQLQFRATTLSAFPPFNSGPGQQFVVDTTAFGLNVTQQMANFARAVITSVEQFTHNVLHTPVPLTTAAKPASAVDVPAPPKTLVSPNTPTTQQDSIASTFSPKPPKLPAPPKKPRQLLDAAAGDVGNPPAGKFAAPKLPAPKFTAPKFSAPKLSVPKLSLPKVNHPQPKGPAKD
ncbi:hypothetical protein [Mycolicibacterium mucogenicum]|uniref:Uncharacterized protein n=1 Tax=Mycolicibacterium mucogenicum DSM 44124 TaxID=1226753 RepID=A0A8E4RCG3_MYCMU|nr:hypothetical protein [Mycolicibacterium mucogenicum]QPG71595.1 hypothetical protein C1S78_012025 [Mycolicibacterium mucogenicum DSM 44124]